ncbi:MAG: transglutaminase domain-containing protein [Lachnospiraceae bacterium]|nr:transglutaminase domain-containing protein [Lachnospiraceae bacterium]
MCKYAYKTYPSVTPDVSVLASYASTVFKYKRGDCHYFAVALVYVAKALGYESRLAESVATGRHALCEVKIGSSWRILAVVIQKMNPDKDFFW